ncbi:MAG: MBL fold metallo-hydrolase [Chloroflexota bacterium]
MQVTPGIHHFEIPLPDSNVGHVNIYLIAGKDGYLLLDTGWDLPDCFSSVQKQLEEIGVSFTDISRIVITHIHSDHYGLVGKFKELSGAEFACHKIERDLIDSRYVHMDELLAQTAAWLMLNGVQEKDLAELQEASLPLAKYVTPVYPDTLLHDGDTIDTGVFSFRVLLTPGHSPGHICLYEPARKILLSGDHILPTITSNVGLHSQSGSNPLADFLTSLGRIKKLPIATVLPGHEHPFSDIQPRIIKLIKHHEVRNQAILRTLRSARSAFQVVQGISWLSDTGGVGWRHLAPHHRRLAILEALSHLELMLTERRVTKFANDGVIYYQRV